MSKKDFNAGQKGQMFLIAAVVIVVSIVIIKTNLASPEASKQLAAMKTRLENTMFENLRMEFNNSIGYSIDAPENVTENVYDFANFTENKMKDHSLNFKMVYLGITANETTESLNTTLVNMLDKSTDASITVNSQQDSHSGIINYGKWDTSFDMDPGTDYTLTLVYDGITEIIQVETSNKDDVYTGFFYMVFESRTASHVSKVSKTVYL